MTMVEVVVALLIVTIGTLAVLGLVDAASRNTFRAQQSQVVNDRLQSEVERIKQLPYAQVALDPTKHPLPTHSTDQTSPANRVCGTQFNLNPGDCTLQGADNQALVYNGGVNHDQGATGLVTGGTVDPGPTSFQSGDVSGVIYRFITWQQDASCGNCGQPYLKHLTVIAVLTGNAGAVRAYQELQADVANPAAQNTQGGPPPGPPNPTPWTFWLTDTPCNFNTRQSIESLPGFSAAAGGNPTHNTRGICSSQQNSPGQNIPQAPDLMLTQATPCAGGDCTTSQLYDYATDVEPTQNPQNDTGLQLRDGPSCGTLQSTWGTLPLIPDQLDPNYYQEVHKWLSPPIPSGYDIAFNGQGALTLWTKTINGAPLNTGQICVYLFYRQTLTVNKLPVYVDTPAVNLDLNRATYFTYSENPWPTNWEEIKIPIDFDLGTHLLPGEQLGLAISVHGTGTDSGLQFLYDAPSFDSRLQLQTTSLLPF